MGALRLYLDAINVRRHRTALCFWRACLSFLALTPPHPLFCRFRCALQLFLQVRPTSSSGLPLTLSDSRRRPPNSRAFLLLSPFADLARPRQLEPRLRIWLILRPPTGLDRRCRGLSDLDLLARPRNRFRPVPFPFRFSLMLCVHLRFTLHTDFCELRGTEACTSFGRSKKGPPFSTLQSGGRRRRRLDASRSCSEQAISNREDQATTWPPT